MTRDDDGREIDDTSSIAGGQQAWSAVGPQGAAQPPLAGDPPPEDFAGPWQGQPIGELGQNPGDGRLGRPGAPAAGTARNGAAGTGTTNSGTPRTGPMTTDATAQDATTKDAMAPDPKPAVGTTAEWSTATPRAGSSWWAQTPAVGLRS